MADIDLNVDSLIQRLLEGTLYFIECQYQCVKLTPRIGVESVLSMYFA